jgi:hypothetical protein
LNREAAGSHPPYDSSGSLTGLRVAAARTIAIVVSRFTRACSAVVWTVGLPVASPSSYARVSFAIDP